jgi:general secretion pathway protein J
MRRFGSEGFTLIEVMVAILIFAIMSGIAYRGLNSVLDARAHIVEDNRKWREVSLAFTMVERDVAAAADRKARSRDDLELLPFVGDIGEFEFSRMGDGNTPARRVDYRLNAGALEMLVYPSIDAAPRDNASAFTLLRGVQSMSARFLDAKGQWQGRWPDPVTSSNPAAAAAKKEPLPRAVALTLTLESGEDMTRVFALP